MSEIYNGVLALSKKAKAAADIIALCGTKEKNAALINMADMLISREENIITENAKDIEAAKASGLSAALIDRLTLNHARIVSMADALRDIAALEDPIGEGISAFRRPNGLEISQIRVPIGLIGIIYESRPNVTSDAAGLCLKAGNAVVLRGGKEAINSNIAIMHALRQGLKKAGLPEDAVCLVESTSRESSEAMMNMTGVIDLLIPRGGAGLIQSVVKNSRVPVIETGAGVCHTYIDEGCDKDMAISIAVNAKVSRPSVCNAMETLLVHEAEAERILPDCAAALREKGVELRGCEKTCALLPDMLPASDEDWDTEYNDYILSVKIVSGIDEALSHIARHGTKHSEAIITNDHARAEKFLRSVDAAAVYVNASTRFTDGGEFGLGGEIGISTQKMHARGPMGLRALTSYKYIIRGSGQIR